MATATQTAPDTKTAEQAGVDTSPPLTAEEKTRQDRVDYLETIFFSKKSEFHMDARKDYEKGLELLREFFPNEVEQPGKGNKVLLSANDYAEAAGLKGHDGAHKLSHSARRQTNAMIKMAALREFCEKANNEEFFNAAFIASHRIPGLQIEKIDLNNYSPEQIESIRADYTQQWMQAQAEHLAGKNAKHTATYKENKGFSVSNTVRSVAFLGTMGAMFYNITFPKQKGADGQPILDTEGNPKRKGFGVATLGRGLLACGACLITSPFVGAASLVGGQIAGAVTGFVFNKSSNLLKKFVGEETVGQVEDIFNARKRNENKLRDALENCFEQGYAKARGENVTTTRDTEDSVGLSDEKNRTAGPDTQSRSSDSVKGTGDSDVPGESRTDNKQGPAPASTPPKTEVEKLQASIAQKMADLETIQGLLQEPGFEDCRDAISIVTKYFAEEIVKETHALRALEEKQQSVNPENTKDTEDMKTSEKLARIKDDNPKVADKLTEIETAAHNAEQRHEKDSIQKAQEASADSRSIDEDVEALLEEVSNPSVEELDALRIQAVEEQDFERAAELRDEINTLLERENDALLEALDAKVQNREFTQDECDAVLDKHSERTDKGEAENRSLKKTNEELNQLLKRSDALAGLGDVTGQDSPDGADVVASSGVRSAEHIAAQAMARQGVSN